MPEPHDANRTAGLPASVPADSLDAGLAAGFGERAGSPRSSFATTLMRPVLLKEAEGESAHVVRPKSDAMPPAEQTGDRYRLDGEIARGGMGAVLRGRDMDLGRDLAVKVLLEKHAHRPEVARRFVEEAQIGGQLQHPGVVPVYDIGRFGDRPFFTMKLVKGRTLAAILDDRADASADRPQLLGIALKVAETLAYAHAKGVIHRDLKPANVMVGAFGEVQVMDWGLAKVLAEGGIADEERASRAHQEPEGATTIRTARSRGSAGSFGTETEAGSLLGTPAYMPPEQANGDIAHLDRRADVFGLGAILCEMMTGKPPYVGRSSEEVRRKAANGDLADAMTRLDGCGADAELVGLTSKCLSPEAIDRPKDAQEVADWLSGYLNGVQERLHHAELARAAEVARTEEARATAVQERKAREAAQARAAAERQTRRVALALAATVLLAVTLGGGGWMWIKSERDARMAQTSRDVNDALNQATALRAQADAATVGSAALFAQAREQAQRAVALVESDRTDDQLKDRVRQLLAELDEVEKDRKLIAALDAARLAQAATLSENRFANERAVPVFREAFRAYGLPAGEGEPGAAAERIRKLPAAVREAIVAALDEWDDLAGDPKYQITEPHREWLQQVLAAVEPDDAWGRKVRLANAEKDDTKRKAVLEKLASSADVAKIPARVLTRLAAQLDPAPKVALLRQAQTQYPSDFWVNHNLGFALYKATPPEPDDAVRFLTAAVALRPDSPGCLVNLGIALGRKGREDEEIAYFRKAVALDPKYAMGHYNLGYSLRDKGQVDEAIVCFRKAIALNPTHAGAHSSLGVALSDKGQVNEAIAYLKKAVELDPMSTAAHNNLGVVLCDVKRDYDGALACFRKSFDLDPKNAITHTNLGLTLNSKGEVDAAIASYRTAIELDPKYVNAHYVLGNALSNKGRVDEAIASWRMAIELDPKHAKARTNIANWHLGKGQWDEAVALCRKAIELDPKLVNAHNSLGYALYGKGQLDEAITCFGKALELNPKYTPARANLAKMNRLVAARDKYVAFQSGSYTPTDGQERLGLAEWCQFKQLHRAATDLAAAAFTADPKQADELTSGHRYNAACSAALAAAGRGEDAAKLDDKEKSRLRKLALDWLRADLALRTRQMESGKPTDRAAVQQTMHHWQKDTDLAGIRDAAALGKLPAYEQKAFTQLWADVAAMLKRAETSATKEGKK